MYTNHRHYILLIFAIITLVVTVFGFIFLRKDIYERAGVAAEIVKEVNQIDEKNKREIDIANIYDKSSGQRNLLSSFLVSKEQIVNLIESIEQIGTDTSTNLELSGIVNQEVSKDNKVSTFQSHIEVQGSWSNVMRAFILIENMPYSVSLNNIRLVKSNASKSQEWTLSLDARVLTGR
jgi:Tfp pilus assembly protein PilO